MNRYSRIIADIGIEKNGFFDFVSRIDFEVGFFPSGEIKLRIKKPHELNGVSVFVKAMLLRSDDIMTLVMLKDALDNCGCYCVHLFIPYVPYSRQDRVCNEGESFSLRRFASILNSLNFKTVQVCSPHSNKTKYLIDRINIDIGHFRSPNSIDPFFYNGTPKYILCPDKGAINRCNDLANRYSSVLGVVYCEKVRDPNSGKIISVVAKDIPEDFNMVDVIIIDDICDGGRSFIEIAKYMISEGFVPKKEIRDKRMEKFRLHVTHGIFSNGISCLYDWFDVVSCDFDFYDYIHTKKYDRAYL